MGIKLSEINISKVIALILTIIAFSVINYLIWEKFPNNNPYVKSCWTFSSLIVTYYWYYIVLYIGNKTFNKNKVSVM